MKLFSFLKRENLDAFLVTNPHNVFYLTNFTGSNAQVLILKDKKFFFTDSRYQEQSKYEVNSDFEIIVYKKFIDSLKEMLYYLNLKKIGFESKHLTYFEYKTFIDNLNIELYPLENTIENIRIKKKKKEISKIKKAIQIAEKSFLNRLHLIYETKITERELALALENEMIIQGADSNSFDTIVASGERSSIVHAKAVNKNITKNSSIIIDFGARYKGYCSDKTVTLISEKANPELKRIYTIVKDAKNYAIEKIKIGTKASDIDKVARDFIDKKGFGKFFLHSLGHGIGVEVHEKPTISPLSDDIIEEKMVFTIEPGIYIEGIYGVRLEDMVYVTKDGAEVLTTLAEESG